MKTLVLFGIMIAMSVIANCARASEKDGASSCGGSFHRRSSLSCIGLGGNLKMTQDPSKRKQLNVLGSELKICGKDPVTGFFRTGSCETDSKDRGVHTVCATLTQDFLDYSRSQGNDLITPVPELGFQGLKAGQKWCLCAGRWLEAERAGQAPPIDLAATHARTLDIIPLEVLKKYQIQ